MSSFRLLGLVSLLSLIWLLPSDSAAADAPPDRQAIDSLLDSSIELSNKVVYVDFWATWCPPCRRSFPWMKDLLSKYEKQGFQVVTVSLDKHPDKARKFVKEMGGVLPVVFDSSGALAARYGLEVMPTSYLYGRDGTLRLTHEGFVPEETSEIDSLINALLKEKPEQ